MTPEEKGKAYDIVRKKIALRFGSNIAEEIFSEFEEPEDEKIRKAIHIYLDWLDGRKNYAPKGEYSIGDMIAWIERQGGKESDPRYENLEELLAADNIYQMSMNDEMVREAKEKAVNALSGMCIGKLLELEKQGKPTTIDIDKMVNEYANNNECGNEEFGKPVNCMIRAYRQGINDILKKQGEWSTSGKIPL